MPKITLKQTFSLTIDSNDYEIRKSRQGQDCCWCPLLKTTRNLTESILKANHTKCYEVFEKVFGGDCRKTRITRKS